MTHINVSKKQREWLFTCFLLLHNYIIIKLVTEDNRNVLPYSFKGLKSKMSLSTTKKMKAELCSLWRLSETPFQLLALGSYSLAPGLLLSSNQQSLVEPFSHVTPATSHASSTTLTRPYNDGGSTEII